TKTVTVLVLVATGSKYETKEINGISHFLEHMVFKGTEKRPTAFDIAEPLDRIGSQYNAFTSQEYTGYYVKADAIHLDLVLNIITDITLNPKFDQNEINKERGAIIEENNMHNDDSMWKVHELWSDLLYGDQPAGWGIGGKKEVINRLKKDNFIKYHESQYVASNIVLVVSGAIDEKKTLNNVKQLFKNIRINHGLVKLSVKESQNKPETLLFHRATDQTNITLGVRAYSLWDKRRYALQVLATILGGGISSRLFQSIREKLGAVYYVGTESEFLTDHGYLVTSAGINNKKVGLVISEILKEYKKIKTEKIGNAELSKAKERLRGGLILSIETSDELASFYGSQEIIRKSILKPEDIIKKLMAVTSNDILEVAQDIFKPEK
ncbi:MAG: pitrilysin family protein, partial [Patescibacteria group bacterium]